MSFPVTIGVTHYHENRLGPYGPFKHGDNLYLLAVDKTNENIEVWKSTDSGATWALQDAVNAPEMVDVAARQSCGATIDGDTLWILFHPSLGFIFIPFDLLNNVYGTASSAPVTNSIGNLLSHGAPLWPAGLRSSNELATKARGTEAIKGTTYYRVKAVVLDVVTDTLSLDTAISPIGTQINHDERGIVLGSSGRTHYFWSVRNADTFHQRTLKSDNSLGTVQEIANDIPSGNVYATGWAARYDTGTGIEIAIPYVDTSGNLKVLRAISADDPTWTMQTVTTTAAETAESNPASLVYDDDGVLYCFFVRDDNGNIEVCNDQGTGTWTTPEAFQAATCKGISVGNLGTELGVYYSDNGTGKYNRLVLAVDPTNVSINAPAATADAGGQVPVTSAIDDHVEIERRIGIGGEWVLIAKVGDPDTLNPADYLDEYEFVDSTEYFYRARRYEDGDYSDWSNIDSVVFAIVGAVTVSAPTAVGDAQSIVPIVSAVVIVSTLVVPLIATATSDAIIPNVIAHISVVVSTISATSTSDATSPIITALITINATVIPPPTEADTEGTVPSIAVIRNININSPIAVANSQSDIPTVSATKLVSILPPISQSSIEAVIPNISSIVNISILIPIGITNAEAFALDVSATHQVSIISATAQSSSDAGNVQLYVERSVHTTIASPTALCSVDAVSPNITSIENVSIATPSAVSNAQADVPSVLTKSQISITSPQALSEADAIVPQINTTENINIVSLIAESETNAIFPSISTTKAVNIDSLSGQAEVEAIIPSISNTKNINIFTPIGTSEAKSIIPSISTTGSINLSVNIAMSASLAQLPIINTTKFVLISSPSAIANANATPIQINVTSNIVISSPSALSSGAGIVAIITTEQNPTVTTLPATEVEMASAIIHWSVTLPEGGGE